MKITDEMLAEAELDTELAPNVAFSTELALRLCGVTDPHRVLTLLLSAAWVHHKEHHGERSRADFANMLRSCADRVEAMATLN